MTRRSRDFSVGKSVATRVRRLISLFNLSRRLVVRSFFALRFGQGKDGQAFRHVGFESAGEVGDRLLIFFHDRFEPALGFGQIGRIENGAQGGGDFRPQMDFGHEGHGVLLQVKLAALPGDTGKPRG